MWGKFFYSAEELTAMKSGGVIAKVRTGLHFIVCDVIFFRAGGHATTLPRQCDHVSGQIIIYFLHYDYSIYALFLQYS